MRTNIIGYNSAQIKQKILDTVRVRPHSRLSRKAVAHCTLSRSRSGTYAHISGHISGHISRSAPDRDVIAGTRNSFRNVLLSRPQESEIQDIKFSRLCCLLLLLL
jgi:hypothetical protein